MKLSPYSSNSRYQFTLISILLFLLLGCDKKDETGSCNQFCGDTQFISSQTKEACAALGVKNQCYTEWLPSGADENDPDAWQIVYPVPEGSGSQTGSDVTPPPQPNLAISFTAANEIRLVASRGNTSEPYGNKYEVTRNGNLLNSNRTAQQYDNALDELTRYCYSVVAIDASDNRSVSSVERCLTTPASPLISSTVFSLNQTSGDSVVASDGTIYGGRAFNAVNPDGTLKWASSLVGNYAKPIIGANGVIYSYDNNTVYALFSDGTVNWSYPFNRPISSIVVSIDTVYVSSFEFTNLTKTLSNITALNLDGTYKWDYADAANRFITLKALGTDGTPFLEVKDSVTFSNGVVSQIQALNIDGSLKWEYVDANNSGLRLMTVDANGNTYLESKKTAATITDSVVKLQTLNQAGTLNWEYTVELFIKDVEIASDGSVYLSGYSQPNTIVEALNSNGVPKWNYTEPYSIANTNSNNQFTDILLASDGKLYFSDGHKLHSLFPDGTTNWVSAEGTSLNYVEGLQLVNNNTLVYIDSGSKNIKIVSYGTDGTLKLRYAMNREDAYNGIGSQPLPPLRVLNEILIFGGTNLLKFPL